MQAIKLFSIVNALIISGCASVSDIEHLQSRINALEAQIPNLNSSIASSKSITDKANTQSVNAEAIAHRAEQTVKKVTSKLDEMFKIVFKCF